MSDTRIPDVRLDWKAYFDLFREAHGMWPVEHGGRLLFPDGWAYSATDHAGPEWPPPKDAEELRKLRLYYWERRRDIVRNERDQLRTMLTSLQEMQRQRPLPLQQAVQSWEDKEMVANGQVNQVRMSRVLRGEVDWRGLEGRLSWLCDDVDDCDREIAQLQNMKVVA